MFHLIWCYRCLYIFSYIILIKIKYFNLYLYLYIFYNPKINWAKRALGSLSKPMHCHRCSLITSASTVLGTCALPRAHGKCAGTHMNSRSCWSKTVDQTADATVLEQWLNSTPKHTAVVLLITTHTAHHWRIRGSPNRIFICVIITRTTQQFADVAKKLMKRDGKKKKKPFPPQDVFTQINTRRNDKKCIGEKPPVSIVLLRIRCAVAAPSFARAANLRSAAFCSASRGRRVRSWCPWTSSCRGRLG